MKKNTSTKHALVMSVISLLVCLSMFVGSTFAWFTDSVSSVNNIIQSGNLDVELEYSFDGSTWMKVSEDTALFDSDDLWEPGHTEVVALRIKNAGTLALKYNLATKVTTEKAGTNVYGESFNLSDHLDVYGITLEGDALGDEEIKEYLDERDAMGMRQYGFNTNIAQDQFLLPDTYMNCVIRISMPNSVGNEANYKYGTETPYVRFGINLLATQAVYEEDAFGSDYDEDAEYEIEEKDVLVVGSAQELEDALTTAASAGAGDNRILLTRDLDLSDFDWTPIYVDGYHGADIVTFDGNGKTITGLTAPLFEGGFAGGSGIVIQNLTIADSEIVSENDQGSGAFIETVDSMENITLINCHLKNSTVEGSRVGGLIGWTSGYDNENDGPVKTYVTVENCSVVDCEIIGTGSAGGIFGHAGANAWTYTTVKNCIVSGTKISSSDDGGWRVGVVVGTANVGELTITDVTEENNILEQTDKTAPDGQSSLYGRFVPGTTGKLVIDDETITA